MRTVSNFLGLLMAVFGVFLLIGSYAMPHIDVGGVDMIFVFGMVLTGAGAMTSNRASHKTCLQCSEQVKLTALKCKHCGSLLSLT
jgi:hypothetical protein